MLQAKTILQYFYKLLLWPTSYWFPFWSTPNITLTFTNNYLSHQQFVKFFIKNFVSLTFSLKKKKPYNFVSYALVYTFISYTLAYKLPNPV